MERQQMHRACLTVVALVVLWGCSAAPQVDPSQTQAIYDDAHVLLEKYPSRAAIDATFWPERGVFVPRDRHGFSPLQGADPEYRLVANAVFVYRARG